MKVYKQLSIVRNGSNRPAEVIAITEADLTYRFTVSPVLSDAAVVSLLGSLIDHSERGDTPEKKRRHGQK
ncbi:MAG: hypothetical protein ACQEXQ_07610 [Bacillota bacterium]